MQSNLPNVTLPETNSKRSERIVFQPSICRGYVSFREGIYNQARMPSTTITPFLFVPHIDHTFKHTTSLGRVKNKNQPQPVLFFW